MDIINTVDIPNPPDLSTPPAATTTTLTTVPTTTVTKNKNDVFLIVFTAIVLFMFIAIIWITSRNTGQTSSYNQNEIVTPYQHHSYDETFADSTNIEPQMAVGNETAKKTHRESSDIDNNDNNNNEEQHRSSEFVTAVEKVPSPIKNKLMAEVGLTTRDNIENRIKYSNTNLTAYRDFLFRDYNNKPNNPLINDKYRVNR